VTVDAAGSATAVRVLEDPGNGFGRAAVKCAMAQTYVPALDADGIARPATTPPIRIRFKR
jgi:protein TonB